MRMTVAIVPLALAATFVVAAEQKIELKSAPGRDKVEANCIACHTLDYIVANSPFMNRQMWEAEVTKMVKAFGAPITDTDQNEIVEYLTVNYGKP
jgi:sulfite dehydrogenase (cytochrome) subunit B